MSFASLAEQRTIALQFACDPAWAARLASDMYFDRDKIEKIFYNLLSNAFKFTPEGGEVRVQVEPGNDGREKGGKGAADDGEKTRTLSPAQPFTSAPKFGASNSVRMIIKDTGIGIPADRLPHVFDRFYQVDDTHTCEHEGTGLGLALTKELVERHYGEIEARSEAGTGSEFIVWLPLGRGHLQPEEIVEESEPLPYAADEGREGGEQPQVANARPPKTYDQPQATGDRPLILVVDDHPDVRHYIRKHLEPEFHIIEAQDGQQGAETAREAIPDLVVIDGYQLCAALKTNAKTSHIPVVLLTAKAGEENKLTGLETGADDYLIKPFSARELQARAKNLIALRRKLRERFRREGLLQPREVAVPSVEEAFVRKLMQATEQHLGEEDFAIEVLQRELNMGPKQLYRKIKALTGQTPTEFVRTIRLRRARQLLEQRAGTISEIAFQVGFNNLSYFSKCFREEFGALPSELIKA